MEEISDNNKKYSVFRKAFHIPSEWANDENIKFLVEHEYATKDTQSTLCEIHSRLSNIGYAEDNDAMIHDYLHYMIMDLLDKNGEVYISENDIKTNGIVKKFLLNTTPDLVIKGNKNKHRKRLIVDIYIGDKKDDNLKSKYKKLALFSDFIIINKHDFSKVLLHNKILPKDDVEYLYANFQIFLTEYYYWRSCIKLQKVIFNDIANIKFQEFDNHENIDDKTKFILTIEELAQAFVDEDADDEDNI
jgi:hypothetical protein